MKKWVCFLLGGVATLVSAADLGSEQLENKAFARQSAHKVFLAKIELGEAKVQSARAQVVYEDALQVGQPGVSKFELQSSELKVLEANIAVEKAKFHLAESIEFEKMYRAKIEALQKGVDVSKKLAQINVSIAQKRLELQKNFKESFSSYLKVLAIQKKDSESLVSIGAISKESWKLLVLGYDAVVDLLKISIDEIEIVKKEWEEAQTEAAALP